MLPVDLYAINKVGIDKWQNEYNWPISDHEFFEFVTLVLNEYGKLCVNSREIVRDLFLIDHAFITYFIQVCHANAVKDKSDGVVALSKIFSKKFYYPDWESFSNTYLLDNRKIGIRKFIQFTVKRVVKNFVLNKHISLIKKILKQFKSAEVWSIGTDSIQKNEFIASSNSYCSYRYAYDITSLNSNLTYSNTNSKILDELINSFLVNIKLKGGRFSNDINVSVIRKSWGKRLGCLSLMYQRLVEFDRKPRVLHVSDVANPLHKLIALSFIRSGVVVNGYNHGNNMMLVMHKLIPYTEISHCTNYICSTKKSAEYFEKAYANSKLSKVRQVNFVSTDTTYYREQRALFAENYTNTEVKKILIVGHPLSPLRLPYGAGLFFYFRLDLEIRLSKYLTSQGYHVTYKKHPDSDNIVGDIMSEFVDVVDKTSFEQAISTVDLILFTYTETTAFSISLCSAKQIIVIDLEGERWNEESFQWVKLRCGFVDGYFDSKNQIIFNGDELNRIIKSGSSSFSYKYIDEVMIPDAE